MRRKVAVVAPMDDPPAIMERMAREFDVVGTEVLDTISAGGGAAAAGIEALVTTSHVGIPNWAWDLRDLKVIGNFGVGYDGIDTRRAASAGVWVTNTPGVLADTVADLTLGLMLSVVRRIPLADRYARQGRWQSEGEFELVDDFCGMRLGMLGMGGIGREIAARAAAFKTEIAYHSRKPKEVAWRHEPSLQELAKWAQVLCCVVPGDTGTDKMVDRKVLGALGPKGYLVNVGRGNVVVESDLIAALRDGLLAGAALDVYADEPDIPAELRAMDNVVIQPHVGSATISARKKMGYLVIDNLLAVLGGERPLTPVNEPAR